MEQFSLDKWLQDKSRKVVTRNGKSVKIVCIDAPNQKRQIYGFVGDAKFITSWRSDGTHTSLNSYDLFFADEEDKLTEFDYAVLSIISDHNSHTDSIEAFAKRSSKKLLDLARKEIEEGAIEFAKSYMEDVNPSFEKVKESEELWKWKMSCLRGMNKAYNQGKRDALKDLPKWKKLINGAQGSPNDIYLVRTSYGHYFVCSAITAGCEYLDLTELENLPKEE